MRSAPVVMWFLAALLPACGGDDGGGTGGSEGPTSTEPTTTMATTTATTMATTATTDSTTASTSAGTMETTDASGTTEASDSSAGSSSAADSSTGTGDATSGSASSGADTNGMCAQPQESCLQNDCCGNLECCSGVPIPKGEAICAAQCPDSDRNIKRDFFAVDVDRVLEKVASLPITTWSYLEEDQDVRHIGPMAQDFKAAFAVGASDKAIAKVDADGVALASVQALLRKVAALESENQALRTTLGAVEQRLERLERRR